MNLRQVEIVHVEIQIAEIIVRLAMARIVLQRGRETIKGFRRVSLLRFDNAEIAIGICHAILFCNRPSV